MKILILGGTRFVGRHVVEALLAADHQVTILNRGRSPDDLPPGLERLRGDRDAGPAGIAALRGRTWDACVDVSGYTPRQVRPSASLLRSRIGRYVFISAVSVYGDPQDRPVLETHPRMPPSGDDVAELTQVMYGRAKVACENLVEQLYGDRCAILRPQIVAGPRDPLDRYSYWVRRAARGGPTLAPGDGSDHVQVIDARDVARFVHTAITRECSGPFNLSGPRLSWSDFLTLLGVTTPVWVPADLLRAADVDESELPLYRPERGPRSGLMDVSHERAWAAGLRLTDPALTARDTRAWAQHGGLTPALSPEREAALIQRATAFHRRE